MVSSELKAHLSLLVKLRKRLNIPNKNKYLFVLPRTARSAIRYPSGYVLLRRFANNCGANRPDLLRATNLRKDLARRCISLNLNDDQLRGLADFMGHDLQIHMSVYRKSILEKDIPNFLTFLDAATSNFKGNASSQETTLESFNQDSTISDHEDESTQSKTTSSKRAKGMLN